MIILAPKHCIFILIFQVEGFDRDLGFNGDLLYVISDGDYDSVFKLDTISGELFVDGPLDREHTSDYLLNITVQDQGSPSPKFASKLLHIIVNCHRSLIITE